MSSSRCGRSKNSDTEWCKASWVFILSTKNQKLLAPPKCLVASFLSFLFGTQIQPTFPLESHLTDHCCFRLLAFPLKLPTGHILALEQKKPLSNSHLLGPCSGSSQLESSSPLASSSRQLLAMCSPLRFHGSMASDFPSIVTALHLFPGVMSI